MIKHGSGRRYYRIKLDKVLNLEFHIVQINGRKVKTKSSKARILDISPGGLSFLSGLNFPLYPRIILEFRFHNADKAICNKGYIVRKIDTKEGLYEYGIRFTDVDHSFRDYLVKIFNMFSIRKNKCILVLKLF